MSQIQIDIADNSSGAVGLILKRANRHGFIAGATGTGKTVTLQTVALEMARAGIPIFAVDIKGDLSGIAIAKDDKISYPPTQLWDIFGKQGLNIRTTISEFGPLLFSRLLSLSEAQAGIIDIAFQYADDQGLLLIDIKDMRALLNHINENKDLVSTTYGLVSTQSVAAIQRELLRLEQEGGDFFFAEPAVDLNDLIRTSPHGLGVMNILAANELIQRPQLYATFLLWLLAELFEELPEVGDLPQPKLCLFFDEAHLMFNDAPPVVIQKIEQAVRLIRSKGVGVYLITQNPLDIPESILAQLGNRFQHALRAYTPKEQKAIKVAAETFRANTTFDTAQAITMLGIGEALISTLDDKGAPSAVERAQVRLPLSRLGTLTLQERDHIMAQSPLTPKYTKIIERESAYERLQHKAQSSSTETIRTKSVINTSQKSSEYKRQNVAEVAVKSVIRAATSHVGRQIGRQIVRGLLGALARR